MSIDARLLDPVKAFLPCETPDSWVREALQPQHMATLLIDHANVE